jgi:predicted amidohydrolase
MEKMLRSYKIACIQGGPNPYDKEKSLEKYFNLIDEAAREKPDLILLGECFGTKFFPPVADYRYFKWAEPVPEGPTTKGFAEKAKKYGCYIVGGVFEKGDLEGEYFNSGIVVGPDGKLVPGTLPEGKKVRCYRKTHIPIQTPGGGFASYEKFYFRPGFGFPVFDLGKVKVGIAICYDIMFPETARCLLLNGADILLHLTCGRSQIEPRFTTVHKGIAVQNKIYVVFTNKGGTESIEGPDNKEVTYEYWGKAAIYDLFGNAIVEGPLNKPFVVVVGTVDLSPLSNPDTRYYLRDRRPDTYQIISQTEHF